MSGISGRIPSESVDGMDRNQWATTTGIRKLGFEHIVRTIQTDEIYRKAYHNGSSAEPYATGPASPPFWFDQWREENYKNLLRRDMHDPDAVE